MSFDTAALLDMIAMEPAMLTLLDAGVSPLHARQIAESRLELHRAHGLLGQRYRELLPQAEATLQPASGHLTSHAAALARAQSLRQALAETPIGLATTDLASQRLTEADLALDQSVRLMHAGHHLEAERLSTSAFETLVEASAETFDRLRYSVNRAAARDLGEAVRTLGFSARVAEGSLGEAAVWATRGDQHLAAVVNRAGNLEIDVQGYEGSSCQELQSTLFEELRRRGWSVNVTDAVLHGRRSGGALIAEAARVAREQGCSSEQALLALSAPRTQSTTTARDNLLRTLRSRQRRSKVVA